DRGRATPPSHPGPSHGRTPQGRGRTRPPGGPAFHRRMDHLNNHHTPPAPLPSHAGGIPGAPAVVRIRWGPNLPPCPGTKTAGPTWSGPAEVTNRSPDDPGHAPSRERYGHLPHRARPRGQRVHPLFSRVPHPGPARRRRRTHRTVITSTSPVRKEGVRDHTHHMTPKPSTPSWLGSVRTACPVPAQPLQRQA